MTLPKVLWLVIDGLPFWLVDHMLSSGDSLPALQRLYHLGRIHVLKSVSPNCQTPPSLASLFWGEEPVSHRILGFDNPLKEDNPLGYIPAFSCQPQNGLPVWERIFRDGGKIRLCQVPFVDTEKISNGLNCATYGFSTPIAPKRIIELSELPVFIRRDGANYFCIAEDNGEVICLENHTTKVNKKILKEGKWTSVSVGGHNSSAVCLQQIEGSLRIIFLGAWDVAFEGRYAPQMQTALNASPFLASSLSAEYRSGRLGATLSCGGCGQAENILAGALEIMSHRYSRELQLAGGALDSQLVIAYQPFLDILLHEIAGFIVNKEEKIRLAGEKLILRALKIVERSLALLYKFTACYDYVLACSDHGMRPVDMTVYPNTALLAMGFLSLVNGSLIDPWKSLCFFHPSETGVVLFNKKLLQSKNVSCEDTMRRISEFISYTTGRGCSFFRTFTVMPEWEDFESTYFLSPGSGQVLKAAVKENIFEQSRKTGDHSINTGDTYLDGIVIDLKGNLLPGNEKIIGASEIIYRFLH